MLGTLQVSGRKHLDITNNLAAMEPDGYLDIKTLKENSPGNMTVMGILIEHETATTSEVRGILYDDADVNVNTFRLTNNTPQWMAFRHIYLTGTDLEGRRIKILGA